MSEIRVAIIALAIAVSLLAMSTILETKVITSLRQDVTALQNIHIRADVGRGKR